MRTELLTVKELASVLKRAPGYVYAMRARGFSMPGNRTTVEIALRWLEANPHPRRRQK
jgi:hypothetical protein